MNLKLDENLPGQLAAALRQLGHDVHTVPDENLAGHPDSTIWAAVQSEQRFLITQDLDFSDVRRFQPGTHCGLLLVRLHAPDALPSPHGSPRFSPASRSNRGPAALRS